MQQNAVNMAVNAAFTQGISFSCPEIDNDVDEDVGRRGGSIAAKLLEVGLERTIARRFKADGPPRINHPNNRAVPSADSPKRIYIHTCCVVHGHIHTYYTQLRASVHFVWPARISHALFRDPDWLHQPCETGFA